MRDDFELALAQVIDERLAREHFRKVGLPMISAGFLLLLTSMMLLLAA